MRRIHFQPGIGLALHPTAENFTAREDERVNAVTIDNGELQVHVKGRD